MTTISNAVTLIPWVTYENGANEKNEDDIDDTIEEESDKIICKCRRKLTIKTRYPSGLAPGWGHRLRKCSHRP